ncbi:MFS transporter [Alicyclobacillaceae bacterium I2511]|nr:MFS transporter [Alicyclobacillaceae bacterium I2511]
MYTHEEYTHEEIECNEQRSIRNGVAATVGITILANFAPLFILKPLHGTSEDVTLLNSLTALMSIFATFIGAAWLTRVHSKLRFCVSSTGIARIFYGLLAVTPLLVPSAGTAITAVLLIALMNFPGSLSNLSWQSLIGELIPGERRASFFGVRNRWGTLVALAATLIPGIFIQLFPATSSLPYMGLFWLSLLASGFEIYYLSRHIEHVNVHPSHFHTTTFGLHTLIQCFHHPAYWRFLMAAAVFNFGWQMAWPLFNLYQIRNAGATAIWISAFNVASQLTQVFTFQRWGRGSEKHGTLRMLAVSGAGVALAPALTVLSVNLPYLVLVNFISGAFVAGYTMLQFNYLLDIIPASERTSYIAHFNIFIGFIGFIAPQIGVWLLHPLHMAPTMFLSTGLRFLGVAMLLWIGRPSRRSPHYIAKSEPLKI